MIIFTKEELAEYLKVELPSVKYLLYQNKIPKVKVGREYRFLKEDIDDWLLSKRERPQKYSFKAG